MSVRQSYEETKTIRMACNTKADEAFCPIGVTKRTEPLTDRSDMKDFMTSFFVESGIAINLQGQEANEHTVFQSMESICDPPLLQQHERIQHICAANRVARDWDRKVP